MPITSAIIGAIAAAVSAGVAIAEVVLDHGRRRSSSTYTATSDSTTEEQLTALVLEAGENDLCDAVNDRFVDKMMGEFMYTLYESGPNYRIGELASELGDFCQAKAVNRNDGEDWTTYVEETLQGRQTADQLPAMYYDQCNGYAKALSLLVERGYDDAASIFGTHARGSAMNRTHGCSSVANMVNNAVKDRADPRLGVESYQKTAVNGDVFTAEAVVVNDAKLQELFAPFLTTITLASGVVVKSLMDLCDHYTVKAIAY